MIPQEAIDASANAIRDDLMKIPPSVRPLVLEMLVRSQSVSADALGAYALRNAATREREIAEEQDSPTAMAIYAISAERMEFYADQLEKNE